MTALKTKNKLKYLEQENLFEQLKTLTKGMSVTRGSFELLIKRCTLEDIEWNHMDQMHRPTIHNTYEKSVRIATGEHFAVSLTEWKRWPFLIHVTDVYVNKGLFYQSLTLAGIVFIHSIISMEEQGDNVLLKDEWFIASRKWFKFLHKPLNKKLHSLNVGLQEEDEQIRQGRFALRKKGYQFRSDQPNYFTANQLGQNTIYPAGGELECIFVADVTHENTIKTLSQVEFIIKRTEKNSFLIWPAVCPHEGGPLMQGNFCQQKVTCPWHGLQFSAVELSKIAPHAARYGFDYVLEDEKIFIKRQESNVLAEIFHSEKASEAVENI